jgi:hypothetical protein
MIANDHRYQKFYDKLKENNVLFLVKRTIEQFDFKGYYDYRKNNGHDLLLTFNVHKKSTQDFIVELLSSSFNSTTYSGHLRTFLTKNKCELSYGLFQEIDFCDDVKQFISINSRLDKLERILNDKL